MGNGLISYVTPIILWLGIAAVVAALVSAAVRPEFVMKAVWIAVILVVVFFILRNTASLQAAIQ